MRRIDPTHEKLLVMCYKSGQRFGDLCERFSIGTTTLARILKRNGIEARHRVPFSIDDRTLKLMAQMYEFGSTCKEIAGHFNTSEFKVRYSLQKRTSIKFRRVGTRHVPQTKRQQLSDYFKKLWNDSAYREKQLPVTLANGFKKHSRKLGRSDYINCRKSIKELRRKVLSRDDYRCRKCAASEHLHIHHVKPWRENRALRFDLNNVITLCRSCHMRLEALIKHKRSLEDFRDVLPLRV